MFAVAPLASPARSKVLFISHDASRTGAPLVLLTFLRWLKANSDVPFAILIREGNGELTPEFAALAPLVRDAHRIRHLGPLGLIYSNTITNGDALAELVDANPRCPVICHVHELEHWIRHRIPPESLRRTLHHTRHYIAVSEAVRDCLIRALRIPSDRIDVIPEFLPPLAPEDLPSGGAGIRRRLRIPENAPIVGACGTTDWRKGPDLFVQLARTVRLREPEIPVHFVWVGGERDGPAVAALLHDARRSGIDTYVRFVGHTARPLDYFAAFDLFVLTSREDPFPLVVLEAARAEKPVVCFDASGGAREFVAGCAGFVVPYLDVNAMADRVVELLHSPALRRRLGRRGAELVRTKYDVRAVAPRILNTIQRFLGATKPAAHEGSVDGHA